MADRYCRNCGHELAENDPFCPNCGTPIQEAAHVPTPEADRPAPRIPPAAERNAWQRLRYGTLDSPSSPPPQEVRPRGVGVWTGVKLGCGMFIVLPIIIIVVAFVLFSLLASGG